jgi:hypothetical protein
MDGTVEGLVSEIIEEARAELARIGVFFEDVGELETYGNFFSAISFRCASVNLQNAELQRLLSEASSSWKRLFRALALEKLTADNPTCLEDCVTVEEVHWSTRSFVRLSVRIDVDDLLEKYDLGEADPRGMEEALEGILEYEARRILSKLNKALAEEYASQEAKSRGEVVFSHV